MDIEKTAQFILEMQVKHEVTIQTIRETQAKHEEHFTTLVDVSMSLARHGVWHTKPTQAVVVSGVK